MAKGFGIAALVLAILSVLVPYGFNFWVTWLAMICAAAAALNGDRAFSIASTIIALVGLVLLSPMTLQIVAGNLAGAGPKHAALLGFGPFVLPIAALVADVARKAETARGRQMAIGAGIVGALLCAGLLYGLEKRPALTPEESARQMVGLPNPATTASAQSASQAAPQVVQAPAPQVVQASSPPPMQTPTGTMVAHLGFETDYRDDSGMGNGASPRGGVSFVQGYAPSSGKAVRFDDGGSAIIIPPSK